MCRPLLYDLFGHSQEERNVQMLRGLHGSLEKVYQSNKGQIKYIGMNL